jgi:23S rRNA (uracil1939-C5)-methyltransferase
MPSPSSAGTRLTVQTSGLAAGGDAIARDADGRVVFVTGALPDEQVAVELTEERRDYARGLVVEVLAASPHRVEPPCPHVARGCGGCDLQHADPLAQPAMKRAMVVDALRRLGRVPEPDVRLDVTLPSTDYRTTVRAAVVGGRAGFRRRRSHDVIDVDSCLVAHPLLRELLVDGRFGPADEVTLRVGAHTGERLVIVAPTVREVSLPDDVVVVGADEIRRGSPAAYHEVVAGHLFRISARSFFQANPYGAERLVEMVRAEAGEMLAEAPGVVDAYSGVGLLAATVALGEGREVTAVEWARSAVADAAHNLDDPAVTVVRADVARWRAVPADLVIADPSRSGLGAGGVKVLAATGARRLVLVSCDVAALGRDTALLAHAGLDLVRATLVDLFPHTHHAEVVAVFDRAEP